MLECICLDMSSPNEHGLLNILNMEKKESIKNNLYGLNEKFLKFIRFKINDSNLLEIKIIQAMPNIISKKITINFSIE